MGTGGKIPEPSAQEIASNVAAGTHDTQGRLTLKGYHQLKNRQGGSLTGEGLHTYQVLRAKRLEELRTVTYAGLTAADLESQFGTSDFDKLLDLELEDKLKRKEAPAPPPLPDAAEAYQRALARGQTDRLLRQSSGRAAYFGGVR